MGDLAFITKNMTSAQSFYTRNTMVEKGIAIEENTPITKLTLKLQFKYFML